MYNGKKVLSDCCLRVTENVKLPKPGEFLVEASELKSDVNDIGVFEILVIKQ